jgi:hypothetical protein
MRSIIGAARCAVPPASPPLAGVGGIREAAACGFSAADNAGVTMRYR